MAGLLTNANYINNTIKPAIKSAIEAQGVTVPSTDSFLDYANRISEIEGGGGDGYVLQDLPTGSISTFTDGVDLPLNSLKVSIEAVQSGSGTPSPSNVRPITGWDSVDVNNKSNDLHNYDTDIADYYIADDGNITYNQTSSYSDLIPVKYGASYIWAGVIRANTNVRIHGYDENGRWLEMLAKELLYLNQSFNISITIDNALIKYVRLTYANNINGTVSLFTFKQLQTTTIPLSSTCYGGELDVTSGELKVTHGNIASYNGETLPSTWISSMDEYTAGGTPTTGAQVVYELATPTTTQLAQPTAIRTLDGDNNLWADCGDVLDGEYFSGSAKGYVDGIKYSGEGDGGIASYTNIKSADELTGATAVTFEVFARIDSYVNKTSGAYARIMEFGDSQQSGRLGFLGLASDASNNICYWDDSADIASGIDTWTLGDTHLVSVVKTTAGVLKIYVDGVLKYTGTSTLTITTSIINYIAERGGYSSMVDNARRLNGEIYAWRIYAKELSAVNIAQNLAADRALYVR